MNRRAFMGFVLLALIGTEAWVSAQEDDEWVDRDPYVALDLVAPQTHLLPGEPPVVYAIPAAAPIPYRHRPAYLSPNPPPSLLPVPGATEVWPGETRLWIAREGGPWQRMGQFQEEWVEYGPVEYFQLGKPIILHPRPWTGRPSSRCDAPPYAFREPGIYLVRTAGRLCFFDDSPPQPPPGIESPASDAPIEERLQYEAQLRRVPFHVTPLIASNIIRFEVTEPPASEVEPWDAILSSALLSGACHHPLRDVEQEWEATTWDLPEAAREFVDRFPGSRYSDHIRVSLAWETVSSVLYGPQGQAANRRDLLERAIADLEAIRLTGFSQADRALRCLSFAYGLLGRESESRDAWDRLQALPYYTPLKESDAGIGERHPCADTWAQRYER